VLWFAITLLTRLSIAVSPPLDAPITSLFYLQVIGFGLAVLAWPICLFVAVLRHQLFDIDLIVNRALVYGGLTASVAALYVLVVGGTGTLLETQASPVLSLVAAGVVALVFQPLRERLQRGVDRLLYGDRDDPYAVVARLGRQLEAVLEPDAVLPAIVETVATALRLPYVAVVLGSEEAKETAYGAQPRGSQLSEFQLFYQGSAVGRLLVAPRASEATLATSDRLLLEDLARQAGVAVHAVQLTNDLRRSRERLVSAREEERRRLRRDLHDGLGPALASQALTIDTIGLLLDRDPAAAALLIGEVKAQSRAAIAEIRRVVYALRPPALDDLGLVGALRDQASRYAGSGLQIRVEGPDALPTLPAAVEVAAYRIAQEALTNIVRHAHACRCTLSLSVDGVLTLVVSDDGDGIPPNRQAGVGLSSMRERAEELGGALEITTSPGAGTTVRATLPITQGGIDGAG